MEEVVVEDLVDGLMEAKMMIIRARMRLVVVVRTRGGTIPIRATKIIKEEEGGKDLEEEVSMENVSIAMKKGINLLNVLNTKEEMIEKMNDRPKLQIFMKIPNHHILKMLKEKSQLIEESY